VVVELEGHGREELAAGEGAWRTVGWLTTLYPVVLEGRAGAGMEEVLAGVKRQTEGLAEHGLWYGVVRYLRGRGEEEAAELAVRPWLSFNYLGQLDQVLGESKLFAGAGEGLGETRSGKGSRWHEVEVNAAVVRGRLEVEWSYGPGESSAAAVAEMAQEYMAGLRELIVESGGAAVNEVININEGLNIEAINNDRSRPTASPEEQERYGLTPTQEGMLFHSLLAPQSSVYIVQKSYTLRGQLDVEAMQRAWEEVIARHAVLRTSFSWEAEAEPQQIVHRRVKLPWSQQDWRGLSAEEQRTRLEEFLTADRVQGFDLATPPLLRLSLFILGDDVCQFTWTHHHLLLDGWSTAIVLQEVSALYQAYSRSESLRLPRRRPFRDYVTWLREQDTQAAEQFWRRELQGIRAPTPLGSEMAHDSNGPGEQYKEMQVQMSRRSTDAMQQFARAQQVTLNTVVQGAWALLLSRYSGEAAVVFGAVVAGRPAGLAGVEEMVGMFINTLPVRVAVAEERMVGEWMRELQQRQAEAREYEAVSLAQVQGWSEIERGQPLFESIIVFENYPIERASETRDEVLQIPAVRSFERNVYPLAILVMPSPQLTLQAIYEARRFDADQIEQTLQHLITVLEGIANHPDWQLIDISLLLDNQEDPMPASLDPQVIFGSDNFVF
jgi:non-ribosomal peptide synthase protein (TIGR01720 family)